MKKNAVNRYVRKTKKFVRRQLRKKYAPLFVIGAVAFIMVAVVKLYPSPPPAKVDPASYVVLLNTIANGESKGNYNAYFNNVANSQVDFTSMTIGQVMQWQKEYVDSGSPSSAVGKYQIIRPTLNGLVQQLGVSHDDRFDAAMQDRMAIALLERRGSDRYIDNQLTREQFAANIAQEWAALPKVIGDNPEQSYYAGDGLNKSHISIDEVFGAVGQLRKL